LVTVSELLQEIVCCMGQPVAGNPTQFMMERAFEAEGLDWRYLTLEVPPDTLAEAVRGMKAMGFRGGNFTIPHKVAVIQFLDGLSQAAELMGAVNCVHYTGGKLIGENTDGKGFVQSLRTLIDPTGTKVAIFGAGGAARAIAVELGLAGAAHISVINRGQERGQELVALLNERVKIHAAYFPWDGNHIVEEGTQIVINATSIGLGNETARVPIEPRSLTPEMVVADVIFNPPRTVFIREAAERDCKTLDGLGMLVNQGAIAFKIWTGIDPDVTVMREALEEYLEL
jgi:shikimate dehydrogenase